MLPAEVAGCNPELGCLFAGGRLKVGDVTKFTEETHGEEKWKISGLLAAGPNFSPSQINLLMLREPNAQEI